MTPPLEIDVPTRQPPLATHSTAWQVLSIGIGAMGTVVLLVSAVETAHEPMGTAALAAVALIIAARPFVFVLPRPLPALSASTWLAFASAMLFGPGPATLAVWASDAWAWRRRPAGGTLDALFDVFEPAISFWIASHAYLLAAGAGPAVQFAGQRTAVPLLPAVALAATYCVLRTTLTAAAAVFRTGRDPLTAWREQAVPQAIASYALLWLAISVSDFSAGAVLGLLLVAGPFAALAYLARRGFARVKSESDRQTRALEELYQAAIEALAVAVDTKDQVTHGHIRRVQRHTLALAAALGIKDPAELKAMEAASLLHDIGKLAVPDYVLNKPGALTRGEFATMKQHAPKGAIILGAIGFPYPVVPIVRHHHEQWNGRGYPDGLAGDRIPLGARILAVVDCFDALTSDRPYRRKLSDAAAVDLLRARKAEYYDPDVVDTFITLIPMLRRHDAAMQSSRLQISVAEALNDTLSDAAEGTRALKVDLTTPDAIGRLLRLRVAQLLPQAEWCLFVPDAGGRWLWPIHSSVALRPAASALRLRFGDGIAGWVAANRHTIINSDPDLDFREAAVALRLERCVCTPVFAFGTIAGVLSVYTRETNGLSETEIRIVGAIAQELGVEFSRHDRRLAYDLAPLDAATLDDTSLASAG